MQMTVKPADNHDDAPKRKCPGERYEISEAICKARQANRYPKCLLCTFFSGGADDLATGDPKVKKSIFRSDAIVGEVPDEINDYVMLKIGYATGQVIKAQRHSTRPVVIACDKRENSRNLSRIFGEGLKSAGINAVNLGPATPDMLRFAMAEHDMEAAAFISGCNAKAEINGIRIISRDGRPILFKNGIEKIGLIARRMKPAKSRSHGRSQTIRILPAYRSFLIGLMPQLKSLKVVIDGSGGIGGEVIPYILGKTQLDVIKSHCEPDAGSELLGLRFPAGPVNTSVQGLIGENNAHLGMAIDYDGDLCTFYDEKGNALRSDVAGALIARELLELKPDLKIAYDLRSSAAFREEVLRGGGQPIQTSPATGPIREAIIAKGAEYAFDIDGRHLFKAFRGGESPPLALLLLCSALSRNQSPLSAMAKHVARYAYSGVVSHEMPTPEKADAAVKDLCRTFTDCQKDDTDGLTFRFPSWWFHVKHNPESRLIRICVEGPTEKEERNGRRAVEEIIRKYQHRR